MDSRPERHTLLGSARELRPPSQAVRRTIIAVAGLVPILFPAAGALLGQLAGWGVLAGAAAGAILTAMLIGAAWITLGVLAGRRELQLRRGDQAERP